MKTLVAILAASMVLTGSQLLAQSAPEQTTPVPLTSEHHHHLVFTSPQVRAFYVVLPVEDRTLVHQHDFDYLWVGLGDADVINATVNKPQVRLHSKDGALHFARGPFAHAAINVGDTVYRNVTVELLQKQDNPRNLCEEVLEGKPMHCAPATAGRFSEGAGVTVRPDFTTDEIEFDTVTVAAGAKVTVSAAAVPPFVITLLKSDAKAQPDSDASASQGARRLKAGDVISAKTNTPLVLRNTGAGPARFLVFEFLGKS